jgi:hypothetical protein
VSTPVLPSHARVMLVLCAQDDDTGLRAMSVYSHDATSDEADAATGSKSGNLSDEDGLEGSRSGSRHKVVQEWLQDH